MLSDSDDGMDPPHKVEREQFSDRGFTGPLFFFRFPRLISA